MTSPAMFFALSTGRSGTQTLAHVLTQSPGTLCLHEPHPQLVKESVQFRQGRLALRDAIDLLQKTRPHPEAGQVYGESNNRLSLMVPVLVAAFPDARFIWLQRDGRDVVASELQRGGYAPQSRLPWRVSKWARWRPRADRVGAATSHEWASWSRLEKLAWQWDWTHRLIRDDLDRLPPARFRVLQLERLEPDLPALADWLGLEPADYLVERANRRREPGDDTTGLSSRHPNRVSRVEGWQSWTPDERAAFVGRSGLLMDELYPGWRAADGNWQAADKHEPCQDGGSEAAVLRAELARSTVERVEVGSELADLHRSPAELFLRLLAALRRRSS